MYLAFIRFIMFSHVFSCFLINCAGQGVVKCTTGPQEIVFLCVQPREASACFMCFSLTSFYQSTRLSLPPLISNNFHTIAEAPTNPPGAPGDREGFSSRWGALCL